MQIKMKEELNWVNTAKCLCMMFVYYYHSECYCGYNKSALYDYYSPFFLNVFFLVSGFLFFKKQLGVAQEDRMLSWKSKIPVAKNIVYRIIVPTMIFSMLLYFPKILNTGEGFDLQSFLVETLAGGASWFTYALAFAEFFLLTALIIGVRKVSIFLGFGVVLFAIGIILHSFGVPNFCWLLSGLTATLFLVLGGIYWKFESIFDNFIRWRYVVPALLVYILVILCYDDIAHCSIYGIDFNFKGGVSFVISSLAVLAICKLVDRESRLITFMGRNTLPFYFLCNAIPNVVAIFVRRLMNHDAYYCSLIVFIISIIIAFVAVKVIKKYFPFLLDLRVLVKN